MRTQALLICSLALAVLASCAAAESTPTAAPSPTAARPQLGAPSVKIGCQELEGRPSQAVEREAVARQVFAVELCSNASTGFRWEEPVVSDAQVLMVLFHETLSPGAVPPGTPRPVGVAGAERWNLHTRGPGRVKVSFRYSQPWDGGQKGVWAVELDVTVVADPQ
jgi:predicted secreted protein